LLASDGFGVPNSLRCRVRISHTKFGGQRLVTARYFDNVDYDRLAGPWTSFLAALLSKVHPRLPWDTHLPQAMKPTVRSKSAERMAGYESAMAAALGEISRVLAHNGIALVLWTVADADQEDGGSADASEAKTALGFMARLLTEADLRVVAAHRYTTEAEPNQRSSTGRRDPIVLVVQRGSTVEDPAIDRVIAAADHGLPVLDFGLAEILVEFLDLDELEDEIPERYAGTLVQRLAESIHHRDDPRSLVNKLRRTELAEVAVRYGVPESQVSESARGPLVDMVFECLGWVSPSSATYSCLDSIEKLERARHRMKDSLDDTVRRGAALEALEAVEGLMSFASLCFAAVVNQEAPLGVMADAVGRDERFAFGHWRRAFVEIPKRHQSEHRVLRSVAQSHKKADLGALLDRLVKLRNDASHDGRIDWSGPMQDIDRVLAQFAAKARGLVDNRGLPRVLTPLRESRDRFGRITLTCVDSRGHEYTFAMTVATDLSRPFIHIAGDNNPQEVDPEKLSIDVVADLLPSDLFPRSR